jgi:hypothetical protein
MRLIVSRHVHSRLPEAFLGVAFIAEIFSRGPDLVGEEELVGAGKPTHELADADFGRAVERRRVDHPTTGGDIPLEDLAEIVATIARLQVEGQECAKAQGRQPFTGGRQSTDQHIQVRSRGGRSRICILGYGSSRKAWVFVS